MLGINKSNQKKTVEWSKEDKCYVGSIPGWIGKCCHGDDKKKVYNELCQIVEEWIGIYTKDGLTLPSTTEKDWEIWDNEIRVDSETGRLNFLINEALQKQKRGLLRNL